MTTADGFVEPLMEAERSERPAERATAWIEGGTRRPKPETKRMRMKERLGLISLSRMKKKGDESSTSPQGELSRSFEHLLESRGQLYPTCSI